MQIYKKFSCDVCNKFLGEYLYGLNSVSEKANIRERAIGLPDIVCFSCIKARNPPPEMTKYLIDYFFST